jgi:transcriptional regulator with XRE-family HTH domain
VDDIPVYERLRRARIARGETVAGIARRMGVSERQLFAIDEGRLGDLPGGLYARTAIRGYATALAFDADEILSACRELMPSPEDQLSALARLRGLKPARASSPPETARTAIPLPTAPGPAPLPAWRPLAAAAIDGLMVAALLFTAIAGTIPTSGSAASSLGHAAAPVFGLMGIILGGSYFVFFGGVACTTAGERLIGMRAGRHNPPHVDPRTVADRALRCAARDVRYVLRLGAWTGAFIWDRSSGTDPDDTAAIGHARGQQGAANVSG